MWHYDKINADNNVLDKIKEMCKNEDTDDVKIISSYYKMHLMTVACPVLNKFEEKFQTCNSSERGTIIAHKKQLLAAIQDFDNAISEFCNQEDRADDDEINDDSYNEDILFDKIRNLQSSFRYYCEEINKVREYV